MPSMFRMTLRQAKKAFFDRPIVMAQVRKERRERLRRMGGFAMVTARRSMRKRPGPSAPGKPPHRHVGYLKKFLVYAYDSIHESVVVGPTLLPGKTMRGPDYRGLLGETVPELMEYGGLAMRRAVTAKRSMDVMKITANPAGGFSRKLVRGKPTYVSIPIAPRVVRYPARPYMKPAQKITMEPRNISRIYRDAIKAAGR